MSELRFEWDARKAAANLDPAKVEDRFILLGLSAALRVLFVCHCVRDSGSLIRIISARRANRSEQEQYRERLRR